jgi:hypothetical protein
MIEWHGPAGTYAAKCGCAWETGSWDVCDRHRTPHDQHTAEDRAPWCPDCVAVFVDDESEDVEQELERQSQELQSRVDAASDWARDEESF